VNGSTAGLLVLFVVSLVPLLPTEVTILGMGIAAAVISGAPPRAGGFATRTPAKRCWAGRRWRW
jgi:hypothetical protein